MWYFAWILGLTAAVLFGTLTAVWLENRIERKNKNTPN